MEGLPLSKISATMYDYVDLYASYWIRYMLFSWKKSAHYPAGHRINIQFENCQTLGSDTLALGQVKSEIIRCQGRK